MKILMVDLVGLMDDLMIGNNAKTGSTFNSMVTHSLLYFVRR